MAFPEPAETLCEFPAPRSKDLLDGGVPEDQVALFGALPGNEGIQKLLADVDDGDILVDDPVGKVVELPEAVNGISAGEHGEQGHREIAQKQFPVNCQFHPDTLKRPRFPMNGICSTSDLFCAKKISEITLPFSGSDLIN